MLTQVGDEVIVWYNLDSLGRVSMRGCLLGQSVDMHVEDCLGYINTRERTQSAVSITVLEKGSPELFEMGGLSWAQQTSEYGCSHISPWCGREVSGCSKFHTISCNPKLWDRTNPLKSLLARALCASSRNETRTDVMGKLRRMAWEEPFYTWSGKSSLGKSLDEVNEEVMWGSGKGFWMRC